MKKLLALLLAMVLAVSLFVGCSSTDDTSSDGTREPTPDKIVMTIGGFQITAKEYDYAYNSCFQEFYAQYYSYMSMLGLDPAVSLKSQTCTLTETTQTWAEFFMEQAEATLTEIYAFYNAAVAANMTLSEENKSRIDAFVLSYTEAATGEKMTLDAFLAEYFGAGMTEADLRGFLERRLLATQYCDQKMSEIEYSDDKYEAYYEAHKSDLQRVTFRIFTVTEDHLPADASADSEEQTEAAVKDYADLFAKDLTTEQQFIDRALAYALEDEKDQYSVPGGSLATNIAASKLADGDMKTWLFSADRKAGDVAVHKTATASYSICYFISSGRDENNMVSMRHLLLNVDSAKEDKTDAKISAAIKEIYDGWVSAGAKTEDFVTLAREKSEDTGSSSNGGFYGPFYRGTMVSEIEDWLYAEGRAVGDHTIVKSSYGYHIVIFEGYGDIGWKYDAYNAFQEEDYTALSKSHKDNTNVTYIENHRDFVGNN